MRSDAAVARSPRRATRPLIVTCPFSTNSSHTRRLPMPTRARILWTRSASLGRSGSVGIRAQTLFEGFDDLGARDELSEARQVVERSQPESLQEQLRRAVHHGETGTGI